MCASATFPLDSVSGVEGYRTVCTVLSNMVTASHLKLANFIKIKLSVKLNSSVSQATFQYSNE